MKNIGKSNRGAQLYEILSRLHNIQFFNGTVPIVGDKQVMGVGIINILIFAAEILNISPSPYGRHRRSEAMLLPRKMLILRILS